MSRTPSPYVGLRPFREDDSDLFFGRSDHIISMTSILEREKFLSVVGASGSGKSSLVRAGLLPAIRSGFMAGPRKKWEFIKFRPGLDPVRNFADEFPDQRPNDLADIVEMVNHLSETHNVVILVDQFEEIFELWNRAEKHKSSIPNGCHA